MSILSKNTTIGGKKPLLILNSKNKDIDLNTYQSEGIYIFNNLDTATNFPSGYNWTGDNASHLQIFNFDKDDSSKLMQILTRYKSATIFVRYSYLETNDTGSIIKWSTWSTVGSSSSSGSSRNFALNNHNEIPTNPQAGDTYFIWEKYSPYSEEDSFKAVSYTNMSFENSVPTTPSSDYLGVIDTLNESSDSTTSIDGLVKGALEIKYDEDTKQYEALLKQE